MRKPFQDMLTITQANTGWILLAYYAERCPILCEGVRHVPTLQQRHTTTDKGIHANKRPLAIRLVGIGHSRSFSHGYATAQVPRCGDRLLHQMGRGWTISHYHEEECLELCLEKHHLPFRNPQGPYIQQQKAIWQWRIQRFLPTVGDQEPLLLSRSPLGQWATWSHKSITVQDDQDSIWEGKGHMARWVTRIPVGI